MPKYDFIYHKINEIENDTIANVRSVRQTARANRTFNCIASRFNLRLPLFAEILHLLFCTTTTAFTGKQKHIKHKNTYVPALMLHSPGPGCFSPGKPQGSLLRCVWAQSFQEPPARPDRGLFFNAAMVCRGLRRPGNGTLATAD